MKRPALYVFRITFVLLAATLALGMSVPTFAAAATPQSRGTALTLNLNANGGAVGLGALVSAAATLADAQAPPNSTADVASIAAALGTRVGFAADGVAHAAATAAASGNRASSAVDDLQAAVLGAPITATALSGVASCTAPEPVATTIVTDLSVLGTAISATPNGAVVNVRADVVVPGLSGAVVNAAVQTRIQRTTATTATAIALRITLTLNATKVAGGAVVRIPIGTIEAGYATCTLPAAATETGLTPPYGTTAGGTTVTITGTGFDPGRTSVTIGDVTIPARDVTVVSPTKLTFRTPAHPPGPVDVTTVTPNGTSNPQRYTYVPAPTETGLTPPAGPTGGKTTVTITGTGFVPRQTSVTIGGTTIPASDVTVTSPTTLTFLTPPHAAGSVGVVVATPGGTTATQPYAYVPSPTEHGLTPTHGPTAGGTTVTVTGTGFVPGRTTVTIGGITLPARDVHVTSPTKLTFTTPAHTDGPVSARTTTPGGTTAAETYTYDSPPAAGGLDPDQGPSAGGTVITVTGHGFLAGHTQVLIGGTTVGPAGVDVLSATMLRFTAPDHAVGQVTVQVVTPAGTSASLSFTYTGELAATGTNLQPTILLGLLLLLGGAAVTTVGRRRETSTGRHRRADQ